MQYFFDEQGTVGARAVAWWQNFKEMLPEDRAALLGPPPVFEDEKRFMPLQAADLYAWIVRDRIKTPRAEEKLLAKAIIRLFRKTYPIRRHFDRYDMMRIGALGLLDSARRQGLLS